MNILHISSAHSWRGGEQQIAYLIDELSSMGHANFLMHPNLAPIANHNLIKGNCTAISYQKRFSINPLVSLKIKTIVAKFKIDIIHAHDSHAHTFLYLSYRLFNLNCPSVVSRRVDFPISSSSLTKYNFTQIRKIICVSHKINEIVSANLEDNTRSVTVHSGVDLDKFNTLSSISLRKRFSIPINHKIIANISAIADHKDYETFVDTAAQLLKIRSDTTFLIIGGDGGDQEMIDKKVKDMNLTNHIKMTGYIEDAYTLFDQLDIFLFPSKMEGLGTSILDAQSCNIPVVSTYAGGIPELITHDKTGLLSEIGDSKDLAYNVNLLLNDNKLVNRITTAAKLNVKQFSKKNTAEKTLAIYNDVI